MANNKVVSSMGNKFSFSIANASAAVVVIALLAAFFDTAKVTAAGSPLVYTLSQNNTTAIKAAGYSVDAILDDGVTITNVTCKAHNAKFSIRQFREYIKHQALTLKQMTIVASNEDVFTNQLEVAYHTPLTGPQTRYIDLGTFKSPDQSSDTKIELKELNMPLDVETVMLMTIPAERTVNITMIFE